MSVQFEEAFNRFVDVYGLPVWEEKPKSGQSREEIVRMWENELRGFTVEQVRSACYRVIRFKKNMSFPTISHLMAQLVDEQRSGDNVITSMVRTSCPELEIWEKRGKLEPPGLVREAFVKMFNAFLVEFPELRTANLSLVCQNMRENGWWDRKIGDFLNDFCA